MPHTAPARHRATPGAGSRATQAPSRRWRFPWLAGASSLIVLVGVGLFLYPHVASWFAQREQSRVIELQLNNWDNLDEEEEAWRLEQLDLAHAYNQALTAGALLDAQSNVPSGTGTSEEPDLDYWSLLDRTGKGLMARLKYDGIGIDLPVYHGTSDATLLKGVGHLQGTSLPVGGADTRSVLTAHRGLASATMFDNLVDSRIGDTFVVETLGEVLTYRVIEIETVDPDDTQSIFVVPGKDLMTLITCTPLGVNTHRVLVTGERVLPTPAEDLASSGRTPDLPGFPWWTLILGSVILGMGIYIWRSGYVVTAPVQEPEPESEPEVEADDSPLE